MTINSLEVFWYPKNEIGITQNIKTLLVFSDQFTI